MRIITVHCPDLTEIHLSKIWTLSYQDLLECLKLLPNLEVLQLHHMSELYHEEPGDQHTDVFRLCRILETLASHNRFLHTLVLENVDSIEYLPSITLSSFPCLRYFALKSGEYSQCLHSQQEFSTSSQLLGECEFTQDSPTR